jgi:hypothetical protein
MNAEAILTGVVTGILTGGITGYLAALYAMRQFKAQRAFDRQLEWYERTARTLGELARLHLRLASTRASQTPDPDLMIKTSQEARKELVNLQQCISESLLYAEQSSYEQLLEMSKMYGKFTDDPETILKETRATTELLMDAVTELSKPMRKMLGLKNLK